MHCIFWSSMHVAASHNILPSQPLPFYLPSSFLLIFNFCFSYLQLVFSAVLLWLRSRLFYWFLLQLCCFSPSLISFLLSFQSESESGIADADHTLDWNHPKASSPRHIRERALINLIRISSIFLCSDAILSHNMMQLDPQFHISFILPCIESSWHCIWCWFMFWSSCIILIFLVTVSKSALTCDPALKKSGGTDTTFSAGGVAAGGSVAVSAGCPAASGVCSAASRGLFRFLRLHLPRFFFF